jgi:hypothetical protein
MRYLKRQTLNRRIANDPSLYVDTKDVNVIMGVTNSLVLPKGGTAQQPGYAGNTDTATPINGMIRYNSDTDQFEGYQNNAWRTFRFKESVGIVQQNLGAGDSNNLYFGPLNPAPPSTVQSGSSWGGQNILVVVENVLQLNNINYTVVQNPTLPAETYTPTTSFAATTGSTVLYFNTSLNATSASWTGNVATITFATQLQTPFAVGSSIIVTGFSPSGYNGTFTVTGGTTSTVTYALLSNPGSFQYAGAVTSSAAVFPAVNITGATVTGTNIQSSTTVVSYTTDPNTDALTSITLNKATVTSTIAVNTTITIAESTQSGSGYYLKFSTPVPYGKVVIALIGFDQ